MKTNLQNRLVRSLFNSRLLSDGRAPANPGRSRRTLAIILALAVFNIGGAQARTIVYQGLRNTALGSATLNVDPTTGSLVVSGIGPSGNDGVQIDTGDSGGGASLDLGTFNPDLLPGGASLSWAAIGRTDGTLQQITLQSAAGGSGAVFADFTGLGAPTVSVALYSNDTLVAFADGISPTTALATFTTAGTPHGGGLPMILNPCILNPAGCYGNIDFTLSIPDPTGPPVGSIITIPGQGPTYCTSMKVTPGYPISHFLPHYQVKATRVTGLSINNVRIQYEGYVYIQNEGHPYAALDHTALGQAQFNFDTPGTLTLDNLGPSGNDGVNVAWKWQDYYWKWQRPNTYRAKFMQRALGPPVTVNIGAMGHGGGAGAGKVTFGEIHMRPQDTNWTLFADFTAIGSRSVNVQLWQGCTMVSSYPVDNGSLALTFDQAPSGMSVGYDDPDDGPGCGTPSGPLPPWWWKLKWPSVQQVTTPADQVFMIDRIRFAPDSTTPALLDLTDVTFQMAGPQTLGFTSESALRLGLNFNGNQHFPLGQATLAATTTGMLNVGNIGPAGTDGVEIPVGQADYCAVASPSLPLPPPSGSLFYEFHAMLDNVPDRVASRVTLTGNAVGEFVFQGDMSPLGATHYTMLVLNGGNRVASVTNQPVPMFTSTSNCVARIPSLRCDIRYFKCYIKIKLPKLPGDPGPVIQLAPGVQAIGDEVIIMPEDAVRCAGPQNRLLLTATGLDSFQLSGEELGLFGNGHTGVGGTALQPDTAILTADYIGPSGNNGVSVNLNGSLNTLVSFAPVDFSAVQGPYPHPWLQANIFGSLGGLLNQNLGSLRFTSAAAGGADITADFSTIGAASHTIEVWSAGQLVQRIAGHTGAIGTVDNLPSGLGEQRTASPTGVPGFTAPFGQLVHLTIPGNPTLSGDELRVYPENPSQPVDMLQTLTLIGSGFDSFTIVGETTTPDVTPTIAINPAPGPSVVLSVPTLFGYDYTIQTVDALGPWPLPWAPATTFFGDGSVKQVTVPAVQAQQFFRVQVQGPGQ